jgi:hypothetical protein
MKATPPIGYDDAGAPIEEVVTTATRLRTAAGFSLLGALGLVALVLLGREIGHELGMQRYQRVRARRAARRARRR